MIFAHPWMFACAPLPFLVYWLAPALPRPQDGALRVPFFQHASSLASAAKLGSNKWLIWLLKVVTWLSLVAAAASPQLLGNPIAVPTEGRDLMLAIDLSGSMAREDFSTKSQRVDRLTVVRNVAKDFIAERRGDRVGLILFGSKAYLQTPLTTDLKSVSNMLDEAEIGLAGDETAIGDAVGIAVKELRDRPSQEKVVVFLSDGANNAGVLDPLQAAELAQKNGIRIHTIGVGAEQMKVKDFFGTRIVNPAQDLDEKTLAAIAEKTGGVFFRAKDQDGLKKIYQKIEELEPTAGEASFLHPRHSLFQWPLGLALALSIILVLMHAPLNLKLVSRKVT
ncbi:MAG: VWA domain-containing protein [Planctomycetota bacterium]